MERILIIKHKPISINTMYCKNRSWKSAEYNEWSASIFHKLDNEESLKIFKDLREFFKEEIHYYELELKFTYPKEILITKKGSMSSKAHDISNIEKPLIDLLFLPQFFNKPSPYGIQNLNIDDKFIKKMSSEKVPGESHKIEIKITIKTLDLE